MELTPSNDDLHKLVDALIDGQVSDETIDELSRRLRTDSAARRAFERVFRAVVSGVLFRAERTPSLRFAFGLFVAVPIAVKAWEFLLPELLLRAVCSCCSEDRRSCA